MIFLDKREEKETKIFGEIDLGEVFQANRLFYIKVDDFSAFNIEASQLEEFDAGEKVQWREAELVIL